MARRKTLVLSIDSGCWEYLSPVMDRGQMPHVARLIERGVHGVLESTMPPITPVAFSTLITGTNPGKHGIFDWTVRSADGKMQPASAALRRVAPFWHYLNQAGVRVGLFNIPMTYPVQPIEGFLVPGITVPEGARNLTYPPDALSVIEDRYGPYAVDVPRSLLDDGVGSYHRAWIEYEQMQTDAALTLMDEYRVDVLAFNYASLDRINHFSPQKADLEDVLINIDRQIGRFLARYPEANVILMSDHGSRRIKGAFLLGKWLAQNGYAIYGERSLNIPKHEVNFALGRYFQAKGINGTRERLIRNAVRYLFAPVPQAWLRPVWKAIHRAAPDALDYRFRERLDWSRTRVYATSNSGPLIFNRNGGAGTGHSAQEYEAMRETLIRELSRVADPAGEGPLFSQVYRREELYHGPALTEAPDLIGDHYGSTCDLIVDNVPGSFCFVNRLNRFGDHKRDGLFVLSGPDFVQADGESHRARIMDLPATLLNLYDVPIPESFDGRVLIDFLTAASLTQHPVRTQAADGIESLGATGYGAAEEEDVVARLRDLGYL